MNSGIYFYKNIVNNKHYVGQSKNLKRRKGQHERSFLFDNEEEMNHKDAVLLWRAVKKYKRENFIFGIVEFCDDSKLNEMEEYFIECFKSHFSEWGYNILWGGLKLSGEFHPFYGKHHTKESLFLIAESSRDGHMKGKSHSDETKKRISDKMKEFYIKKRLLQKENSFPTTFDKVKELLNKNLSAKEIAEKLNIHTSTVYKIKSNKYPRYFLN